MGQGVVRQLDATRPVEAGAPEYPGYPLVGALNELRRDQLGTFERIAQYGDAVRFHIPGKTGHLLSHPDHVQRVLVGGARNYGKQTMGYRRMRAILGNGLVTSDGDFWLRQRRIAQPAFHRRRIENFAHTMTGIAEQTVASWADGERIDISREMMGLTLRVVGRTLLSREVGQETGEIGDALGTVLEHVMYRTTTPWSLPDWVPTSRNRRFQRASQVLDRVVAEIIAERRREGSGDGQDLLGMLMQARDEDTGEGMNDTQLRDEVMTIFLAGHETTAMALGWTFHLLGQHPEVEQQLRAELREVLGDRAPTLDDLQQLELTDRVVSESMRLYPPVTMIARSARADDDVCGHPVRAGDWVFLSPWVTHRRADLWPEPERFDPDRFRPERTAERPRYAYFPFAGGPRKCIGDHFARMEARLVLATILQRVHLHPESSGPVTPRPLVTLRPEPGLPMRVQRGARD